MLWMLSPWLLLLALCAIYYLQVLLAMGAVHLRDTLGLNHEYCEVCEQQFNVSRLCIHIAGAWVI
eukprot:COSAG02_NODE_8921_length_2400_cov_1.271186_2_plen_65_part_00